MKQSNVGTSQIRYKLVYLFRLDKIMYLFWFFFWFLNALDKFFNGEKRHHEEYGTYFQGWFGVNRDQKFIHYFERLYLPDWMAIGSLYTFGIVELVLGSMFLVIYFKRKPSSSLVRTAFKMGILMFFVFSVGDILFGDRVELWEHGTFFILTLLTYQLYLQRSNEFAEMIGEEHLTMADTNRDGKISTEEFMAFMQRIKCHGVEEDETSQDDDQK